MSSSYVTVLYASFVPAASSLAALIKKAGPQQPCLESSFTNSIYFILFRKIPTPTSPVPSRIRVIGSGTRAN
jgi:hypothetical protein